MIASHFASVRTWIFDLDNTLYPPEARLFDQIEPRMTDWLMRALGVSRAKANEMRQDYWTRYGTTLAGLMHEHRIDPHDYLHDVHRIDVSHMVPDPALKQHIEGLPGRRIVFTNGSAPYADMVLEAVGLSQSFDAIYGTEHAEFRSKPDRAAFERILSHENADPTGAAMFEDVPRNLEVPHDLGMRTVLVAPARPAEAPHIHHHTDDLAGFLSQITPLFAAAPAAKSRV